MKFFFFFAISSFIMTCRFLKRRKPIILMHVGRWKKILFLASFFYVAKTQGSVRIVRHTFLGWGVGRVDVSNLSLQNKKFDRWGLEMPRITWRMIRTLPKKNKKKFFFLPYELHRLFSKPLRGQFWIIFQFSGRIILKYTQHSTTHFALNHDAY